MGIDDLVKNVKVAGGVFMASAGLNIVTEINAGRFNPAVNVFYVGMALYALKGKHPLLVPALYFGTAVNRPVGATWV